MEVPAEPRGRTFAVDPAGDLVEINPADVDISRLTDLLLWG